ncbi:hypothetical protein ABZ816_26385 [Actinosynnema sp. NPDC047251]|uniref:hypothetical protein n=1 Tax=Saccharothrix espanaensis TaxID=103731 RepID=UPI0011DE4473|nr:hypothetical protein [Saccharothrix espanaensis]
MIGEWARDALAGRHYRELGFDSVHVDDLVGDDYVEATAVEDGFRLFDELVVACRPIAREVRAMFVVVLDGQGEFDPHAPEAGGFAAAWDHFTPPEFYLSARTAQLTPYVVEEYKKPYPAGTRAAPHGQYYVYYRCHRQDGDEFTRAVHVEHYPEVQGTAGSR